MQNSTKVLVIGAVWPEPKSSAAGSRMMQLLDLFFTNGYEVFFATTAQNLEFSEHLSPLGVSCHTILLNDASFDRFIAELQPKIVLFDRFMTEEQFGWRVAENCPEALRILNTEDLHSLRQARHLAVRQNARFDPSFLLQSEVAKREIASILRSDLSLMISQFEMELLQHQFKIDPVLLYYLPLFAEPLTDLPAFESRKDFVFIGNFLHEPNWDSVCYLSKTIWPLIREKLSQATLRVYGAYPSAKAWQLHNPDHGFHIMGRAESAPEVIKTAKVMLAPLRFGAGIKGKLLEAMQCGTPSITTAIGAEGIIGGLDWNGFVEEEPQLFAAAAVKIFTNQALWEKCQQNGLVILRHRFARENFESDFTAQLQGLLQKLPEHRLRNFMGALVQHHTLASTKYLSKWIEEKNRK